MRIIAFLFLVHTLFAEELFLGFARCSDWVEIGSTSICDDLKALPLGCDQTLFIENLHRFHDYPEYGLTPSLKWIQTEILKINPAYQFHVLGNTAVIYLNQELVPTEMVKACTVSRLFEEGDPIDDVLAAETTIRIQCSLSGAKNFDRWIPVILSDPTKGVATVHLLFWKGLAEMSYNRFREAVPIFKRVLSLGYLHWRVTWYLADCCFRIGEREYARKLAKEILAEAPYFTPARRLL